MSSISELEDEYKEGLLTEKGYRKKRLSLELDLLEKEFEEGDITSQGLEKKKLRLQSQYGEKDGIPSGSQVAAAVAKPSSASTASQDLVHTTLRKIFGKEKSSGGRPSLKTRRKDKPVTVFLIPPNITTIPKEKTKNELRNGGFMKSMELSTDDNETDVKTKVCTCFPQLSEGFVLLTTTKSGDLFDSDIASLNGKNLLDHIGNGALLIRSLSKKPAGLVHPHQSTHHQAAVTAVVLDTSPPCS